jgi:hypothetical protein
MKLIKFIGSALSLGLLFFAMSCNQAGEKKADNDVLKTDSDTGKRNVPSPKPANLMIIKHKVADFNKWLQAFNADDSVRLQYGLHNYGVSRGIDDSSLVMVALLVDDMNRAKEFASLPALKATMKKAGVTEEPKIIYFDRQALDLSTNNNTVRVMVNHKVKDWDAWKKEFDDHKQARIDAGITDRAVGYEVGNNKMVIIVAVVNDLKKAKDFFNSKELKDKMDKAGIEGPPTIFFYTLIKKF